MIVLANTTDKIQAVLAGSVTTSQLQLVAYWRDINASDYIPGSSRLVTSNATSVDFVSAPTSGNQRMIDYLSVYNADTVNATVTIKMVVNASDYILFKPTLATGEKLEYNSGDGFMCFDSQGRIKNVSTSNQNIATVNSLNTVVQAADVANANGTANTLADVTGMSFSVTATYTYWFRYVFWYSCAATTTGSRWTVNGPAVTTLAYHSQVSLTTTGDSFNTGAAAWQLPSGTSASSPFTTGNIAIIEGYVTPSADGTVIAQFSSEVSASAITALKGSTLQWMRVV